jgi:hypothetical protein
LFKIEKYGFVYIWFDKKYKRYYIGCRWGTETDGYICSSNWMKISHKRRPEDFKRRILKTDIQNRKELLAEEYKFLQMIKKEELGKKYYNLHNHHFNHWSSDPEKIQNIKEKRKLYKPTPETLEKMRQANIGKKYSDEVNKKKGSPQSEESRRKCSERSKGNKHREGTKLSPDHIEAIRKSQMKSYIITKKDGSKIKVDDLPKYCKENSLRIGSVRRVFQKDRKSYHDIISVKIFSV